jgi:hypothetical protein
MCMTPGEFAARREHLDQRIGELAESLNRRADEARADEAEALLIKGVPASRKVLGGIAALQSIARLFTTGRADECQASR